MDENYPKQLLDQAHRLVEQERTQREAIHAEKRMPTDAENEELSRYARDVDSLTEQVKSWNDMQERTAALDKSREIVDSFVRPEVQARQNAAAVSTFEQWVRGYVEGQSGPKYFDVDLKPAARFMNAVKNGMDRNEARAIYTDGGASGGSLEVPVGFQNQIYTFLEEASAMRRISRMLTSDGGGPWTFPKTTTIAVGTQVAAQGTALAGTDPVMGTMRLDSFRYGELVRVSTQAARDTGFDLMAFIAQQIGYAVGRVAGTDYVTGSGSGKPNGIITAASVGAKTGGSLIALGGGASTSFTNSVNPLVVLQHSVAEPYADNGVFLTNRLTLGTLRQLRSDNGGTSGNYIVTPTTTFEGVRSLGAMHNMLGSPVFTDFNVGTQGSAVATVAFGDFSAYYIRDVGGFRFERSDERYFDTDEIAFRGVLETDGDLIDTNAIKTLQQLL